MQNQKRGQVTFFIILGIIMLAVIMLTFYLRAPSMQKEAIVTEQIAPIKILLDNCVKETAVSALALLGQQGGFYEVKRGTDFGTAYFFFESKNIMPALSAIEVELEKYMDAELKNCTTGLSTFSGFDFVESEPSASIKILDTSVSFAVDYPINIQKDGKTFLLKDFGTEIPIRLKLVYDVSAGIIKELVADPQNICISCLIDIAEQNDLSIAITYYTDEILIFTIEDKKSTLGEFPYNFMFAGKFELEEE